jgi:hypothetical protein
VHVEDEGVTNSAVFRFAFAYTLFVKYVMLYVNVGDTRAGLNELFAGAVAAKVNPISEKYFVSAPIPPVYVGVFMNVIVYVADTVVAIIPSALIVPVIIAVPPDAAVPVNVRYPSVVTVQKIFAGTANEIYEGGTLELKYD